MLAENLSYEIVPVFSVDTERTSIPLYFLNFHPLLILHNDTIPCIITA